MGEVPPRAAYLPDTVIGLGPHRLEVIEDRQHLIRRYVGLFRDGALPVGGGSVQDLAVDVELKLGHRVVADTDGRRALIAGEVVEFELWESPFSVAAAHDLHLPGGPRNGPPEPPP